MMRDLLKMEDVVIPVTSQSLFRNASKCAQEVKKMSQIGVPKDVAQKIADLTQTLEATEDCLQRIKEENQNLREENQRLNSEIIKLKARLYDLTTVGWYDC